VVCQRPAYLVSGGVVIIHHSSFIISTSVSPAPIIVGIEKKFKGFACLGTHLGEGVKVDGKDRPDSVEKEQAGEKCLKHRCRS
jgi:hypothetical protein